MIRRLRVSRSPATGARHCPCRVSLHFFDGRGATPFAGVARSSKMTRSSAPEFRSADGSRLHSGECAQSLDVLIPTRRVARLLRGTRSRNTPTGILPRGRLRDCIRSPGTEDPRCYLVKQLHGRAEDVETKRIPADLIRAHVLSTVSPARQGRAFGRSGEVAVA